MSGTQATVLLDEPKEVDLLSIERELARLWKAATEEGGQGSPVVRACSLNLIVVTHDVSRLSTIEQLIGEVTLRHPARIFLIQADPSARTPLLDAWVTARCSLPVPGMKQVCCEQITLNARGPEVLKVPSVVASLLVADIPTILLWKSAITPDNAILVPLAEMSDRLLIDSSEEPDPLPLLRAMRAEIDARRTGALCGDLAWSHATAWRSALAQVFAPEEARASLDVISSISMTASSSSAPMHNGFSQALLVLGWLSSRLGWSVLDRLRQSGQGGYEAAFTLNGRQIVTTIRRETIERSGPGGLEEVRIVCSDGAEALLTSSGGSIEMSFRVPDGQRRNGVFWVRDRDEASVVAAELDLLDRDELYEAASAAVGQLIGDG